MRLDIFCLAPEIPIARFQENEKPYFLIRFVYLQC